MMDYYSHPAIKARIAEFLGTAPASGSASCIFLITGNEHQLNHLKARKISDFPAEPYLHPHRTFALQEVVEATVEKQLLSFGIEPLHLLSGRAHHFIWRIRLESKSFDQLK